METYHDQMQTLAVNRERCKEPSSLLNQHEVRKLIGILGSLQWLARQVGYDLAFTVSSLQSEVPTVGTLLRAKSAVIEAKKNKDFHLIFRGIDVFQSGIMVVTDAALGNVTVNGTTGATANERVHSQGCYAVLLCDGALMAGGLGNFNLIDFRSHRIARVCRSSYAAEALSAEEGLDCAELCRGFLAELRRIDVASKIWPSGMFAACLWWASLMRRISMTSCRRMVASGTQKSLAFTVAAMRQSLRRPNTSYRWTATENLFVDAGTKLMDNSSLRQALLAGKWSIEFTAGFTKQTSKGRKTAKVGEAEQTGDELPGRLPGGQDEALMKFVRQLCESSGWHFLYGVGIQVAHGAKSYRGPEPRFAAREFPFRTTVAGWFFKGSMKRRILEEKTDLRDLPNHHEQICVRTTRLVTFFSRSDGNTNPSATKK